MTMGRRVAMKRFFYEFLNGPWAIGILMILMMISVIHGLR